MIHIHREELYECRCGRVYDGHAQCFPCSEDDIGSTAPVFPLSLRKQRQLAAIVIQKAWCSYKEYKDNLPYDDELPGIDLWHPSSHDMDMEELDLIYQDEYDLDDVDIDEQAAEFWLIEHTRISRDELYKKRKLCMDILELIDKNSLELGSGTYLAYADFMMEVYNMF